MIRATLRLTLQACILASFLGCGPTEKERKQQAEEAQLRQTKALFSSMVSRHRASLDWNKQLKERLFAFSIDIQEAVAAQPVRPLIVFASLRDIYSSDGKRYVVAEYDDFDSAAAIFVLETSDSLLTSITALESPKYGHFAFVVKPTGTAVPLLKALTDPPSEEILIESADAVIVRGQLLDFLRLRRITVKQLTQ